MEEKFELQSLIVIKQIWEGQLSILCHEVSLKLVNTVHILYIRSQILIRFKAYLQMPIIRKNKMVTLFLNVNIDKRRINCEWTVNYVGNQHMLQGPVQ